MRQCHYGPLIRSTTLAPRAHPILGRVRGSSFATCAVGRKEPAVEKSGARGAREISRILSLTYSRAVRYLQLSAVDLRFLLKYSPAGTAKEAQGKAAPPSLSWWAPVTHTHTLLSSGSDTVCLTGFKFPEWSPVLLN